ncbi:MAG: hypothetical protein WA800_00525 [Terriglobales bacterium]
MLRLPLVLALVLACSLMALAQSQHKPATGTPSSKSAGDAQVYRNSEFGFRYQIPYGWVDRTKEMREQDAAKESDVKAEKPDRKDKAGTGGEVLLAVFARPPEAAGASVNSAVVIAKESAAAYPGMKTAEDYLGPLTELATSNGFKANGDASGLTIDERELVRADFSRPLTDKLTMYQTTMVLLAKGQIVSFTFIAGSEDEIDDLLDGLRFGAPKLTH